MLRPECAVTALAGEEAGWSLKTPAVGGAAAKAKKAAGPGARTGEAWRSTHPPVEAAALSGSVRVDPRDGRLVAADLAWACELVYGELATDSRTLAQSVRRKVTIRRR